MNIRAELLKEHSKEHANKISDYACMSKENFEGLIHVFWIKNTGLRSGQHGVLA